MQDIGNTMKRPNLWIKSIEEIQTKGIDNLFNVAGKFPNL
jgi:hypothetical protein